MKYNKQVFVIAAFAAFSLFALLQQGCSKDNNDPQTGTANFNVNLSGSSRARTTTYDEVNIDIASVSFHTSTDTSETSGWFDLETSAGVYNLIDLEAGNDTLIGFDSVLSVQTISQIRLLLSDTNTVVIGGESFDLSTPSAQTTGIKVQVHAELLPEHSYKVVLDFNVDESIIETGNQNYKLKPVINATLVEL